MVFLISFARSIFAPKNCTYMSAQRMKLSHFKFDLPEEQIARYPLDNREDARMMVVDRKTGSSSTRCSRTSSIFLMKVTYS